MPDPTYKSLFYIKDATNNVIYQIKALSLKDAITIALSGDVTGSVSTDFHENVTISAVIANGAVVTDKLADGAVTNPKIAAGTIEHDRLNIVSVANTGGTGIADGQNDKLATHGQVKSYVDGRISGTYKGKKTVAVINTWNYANLNNGEHVRVTGLGTDATTGKPNIGYVQDGYEHDTMGAIPVIDGTDLIYFKETTVVNDTPSIIHGWQKMDGEFKLKQTPVDTGVPSQAGALGGVRKTLTRLEQDENGDVNPTFGDIPTGNGSGTGLVALSSAVDSNSGVNDGVAATPAAVKEAYDLANGKADPDTDAVAGNIAVFDANGNPVDSGFSPEDFTDAEDSAEKDEVVAAALNNHEARIKDLEEFSGNDNLGNKKFDSVDTQNLKINGENIDASDLAKKSEMSVTPGTGANADKSTIQLKNGTSAVVLTRHQDISGKQDALTFMTNDEVDALFANAWGATT